mmetsp:Transcript_23583/g.54886  ORF Transcript_23583/g.54886 Transcript_23583/m.54886 type:complete len:222 (-) Transcript_23583:2602-3267(-)
MACTVACCDDTEFSTPPSSRASDIRLSHDDHSSPGSRRASVIRLPIRDAHSSPPYGGEGAGEERRERCSVRLLSFLSIDTVAAATLKSSPLRMARSAALSTLLSALVPLRGGAPEVRGVRSDQALADRELARGDGDVRPPFPSMFAGLAAGPPPAGLQRSSNCDLNCRKVAISSPLLGSVDFVGLLSTAPIQKSTTRMSSSSKRFTPKSGEIPLASGVRAG